MSRPVAQHGAELTVSPADGLHETYRRISAAFASVGLETPGIDARFLLQGLLQLDDAAILLASDRPVGDAAAAISDAVRRRLAHEPVARILGRRDFYGRTFNLSPAVLDPRPDTETLIDAVVQIVRRRGAMGDRLRVADIGTGSGAIVCTLLCEMPLASGIGTDISASALEVAKDNALRLGVAGRCQFVHTRTLQGVAGDFDIVVSNPPYIATGALTGLDAAVRDYDPREALDGGADGLAVYREISSIINDLKHPWLCALEVGAGQAAPVAQMLAHAAGRDVPVCVEIWPDLAGIGRCVTLERQS